uniref:RAP domain containing protein, putative n=1 Tax=Theileria annulata TaxID=5874 RepID=A0A3B0MXT6_THEAN
MFPRLFGSLSNKFNPISHFNYELNYLSNYSNKGLFLNTIRKFSGDFNNNTQESELPDDDKHNSDSKWMTKSNKTNKQSKNSKDNRPLPFNFDSNTEDLTEEQVLQKQEIIKELTRKLSGPLADENGRVPVGDQRPIAIEVDGPSHFYSNTTKYTAYTKLKHRLLTRMGYKVLHVPFFEWRRLRGAREREEYMRAKLKEEPTEWLEPEDEEFYNKRIESLNKEQESALNAVNLTNN